MTNGETVISVKNVHKDFILPHQKAGSVKNIFTNMFSFSKSSYETQHALKDISFEIKKGEFFGIVGRNGSGKSTLLKILAGIYQPSKGTVKTKGRIVPFIELGVGFNGELTGRENVFLNGALLGFSEKEIGDKYQEIVDFAEIERFMDQKLKNYSSGMQVRLAFSVATKLAESDILLIDEVLAVGDADFQRKCFDYFKSVKKEKKTVVFVSHDMNAIREYCDRAILIDSSEVVISGSPRVVSEKYQRLFINEDEKTDNDRASTDKRWGSFVATYNKVNIKTEGHDILVNAKIVSKKDLDSIFLGIHIFAEDGVEVVATNNRMIKVKDIRDIKSGKEISVEWKIMNVLNDGKYSVTLTMVNDSLGIIDWYTEAAKFSVRREERSTTHTFPPMKLIVKR